MQTKYFKYIKEIEYQGSIKKAAEKLYISQQALSRITESLEDEIGFKIFDRTNKGVIPTRRGEKFLSDLSKIMAIMSEWEQERGEKHKINIMLQYILKDLALDKQFCRSIDAAGNLDIEWETMVPPEIVRRLLAGENYWGIIIASPQSDIFPKLQKAIMSSQIKAEIVGNEKAAQMRILLRHDDELAKKERIELIDLQEKVFVTNKGILVNKLVQYLSNITTSDAIILPRAINAIDYIIQHEDSFTCIPGFVAYNNAHIKNGTVVMRQLDENLDEGLQCYLLYHIDQMLDMQNIILNMRSFFDEVAAQL